VTTTYPNCPESNELDSAEIWDTVDDLAKLKAWHSDNSTNWSAAFVSKQFGVVLT